MQNLSRLWQNCLGGVLAAGAITGAVVAAPASAQEHKGHDMANIVQCEGPAPIPDSMSTWAHPVPLKAAKNAKSVQKSTLTPGQAVTLALLPTPDVRYPLRPEKPGGSVSKGGLVSFTVAEAGTWRVGLGTAAWIDVVKDGVAARSVSHGPGPDCSGIRKMVGYNLTPGTYTLQIAGNAQDSIIVMVTKLP